MEAVLNKIHVIIGIGCLLVALAIIIFGSGLRILYSGGFFVLLGIFLFIRVIRDKKKQNS